MALSYTNDLFAGMRRLTREVRVGGVVLGGDNPIRVQSMTTTDTQDTRATVDQIERLVAASCEIVRVTAPSIRDAENLREIVRELKRRGVHVPLVADIHFTPNAALIAAEHVEKVRINPGNYADKKKFEVRQYSDEQYALELERVADRFRPLVRRCAELGVAMRIGTNHGSLSDRVMNRYGDTPLGMVESALEFLDVCEAEGFRDVVFSMKASNTQVAIQAYRLLAARLAERAPGEPGYPFHIGVTEAGDGEDGRVKSAIGIGSLLEDGIGDTLRVSLTEDPVREVPVAYALARAAERRLAESAGTARSGPGVASAFPVDPYTHTRRATDRLEAGGLALGGDEPVRVEVDLGDVQHAADRVAELATSLALQGEPGCESLSVEAPDERALARVGELRAALAQVGLDLPLAVRVSSRLAHRFEVAGGSAVARFVVAVERDSSPQALGSAAAAVRAQGAQLEWCLRGKAPEVPALVDRALAALEVMGSETSALISSENGRCHAVRALVARLHERGADSLPIVLRYRRGPALADEDALLEASVDLGSALCDGIGDAICLSGFEDPGRATDLGYRILQGARLRTTRTEYISCPSCGRTLFDLETITARIKQTTEHLTGVKIAVMGCIVNGPGEMADADFGYVGSGPGTVTLYRGKEVVARHVPEADATKLLLEIIREDGRWPGA